jgi:hypothetical protein
MVRRVKRGVVYVTILHSLGAEKVVLRLINPTTLWFRTTTFAVHVRDRFPNVLGPS